MINFHLYHSPNDKYLTYVLAFYEQAFPVDERRQIGKMLELIEQQPNFKCNDLFDCDELFGFFNFWNLGEFIYVEHFALDLFKSVTIIGREVLYSFYT